MAIDISKRPDRQIRKITISQKKRSGITSDLMKIIAVIAMTIDHIAWVYVPLNSVLGQIMHILGRITAPVMCFLVAEGYYKTRNVKLYARRLGLFAVLSHIPYVYFETGSVNIFRSFPGTSIMFMLFLGLQALIVMDSGRYSRNAKNIIVFLLCLLSMLGDWGGIGVVWIIIFGIYRNRKTQIQYFSISGAVMIILSIIFSLTNKAPWYGQLFQLGIFLAVPLLYKYNGVRKGGNCSRWFYYIYYPAHMVLLKAVYPLVLSLSVYIVKFVSGK